MKEAQNRWPHTKHRTITLDFPDTLVPLLVRGIMPHTHTTPVCYELQALTFCKLKGLLYYDDSQAFS